MCKVFYSLFFLTFLLSCRGENQGPDISKVEVDVVVNRFDQDFFAMDTLALEKSLNELQVQYPSFTPIYLQHVLGVNPETIFSSVKNFIRLSETLFAATQKEIGSFSPIKEEFENSFRHVKYYFPEYKIPSIITVLGPVDALAQTSAGEATPNFIGSDFIGISLQFYLGKDFELYQDGYFVTNVAPLYRSRRFDKKYIVADAMKLVVDDLFPDNSAGNKLLEQIIEKGKQAWLLDKFMPTTADSIKIGFTKNQLDWCTENEGLIWTYLLENEKDIYTTDPLVIQTYIGDAPFTATLSQDSPGNIGMWIGRQIVRKFVEKKSAFTVEQVMQSTANAIFKSAKYKPK